MFSTCGAFGDPDHHSKRLIAVLADIRSNDLKGRAELFAQFASGLRILLALECEPASVVRIIDQTLLKHGDHPTGCRFCGVRPAAAGPKDHAVVGCSPA